MQHCIVVLEIQMRWPLVRTNQAFGVVTAHAEIKFADALTNAAQHAL